MAKQCINAIAGTDGLGIAPWKTYAPWVAIAGVIGLIFWGTLILEGKHS
jgi:hypothetical protein